MNRLIRRKDYISFDVQRLNMIETGKYLDENQSTTKIVGLAFEWAVNWQKNHIFFGKIPHFLKHWRKLKTNRNSVNFECFHWLYESIKLHGVHSFSHSNCSRMKQTAEFRWRMRSIKANKNNEWELTNRTDSSDIQKKYIATDTKNNNKSDVNKNAFFFGWCGKKSEGLTRPILSKSNWFPLTSSKVIKWHLNCQSIVFTTVFAPNTRWERRTKRDFNLH